MNKSVKFGLKVGIGSVVILGTVFSIGRCDRHIQKKYSNLYQKVSVKADMNYDGMTNQKEWAEVYRKLGIHFDVYTSNPKNGLTSSQLEKYLSQ